MNDLRISRGNALFLVLIGVALFAALAYAVTQSGRGGSSSISQEQAKLYASQILQMAQAVKTGVDRMVISGTPANTIRAGTPANTANPGAGTNNTYADFCATGDGATCLFAAEGGRVQTPLPPRGALTPGPTPFFASYFAGPHSHNGANTDGLRPPGLPSYSIQDIGTANPDDLLMFMPIRKEVCQAINAILGINSIPQRNTPFILTLSGPVISGQMTLCMDFLNDGSVYLFYQVLVAN